MPFYGRMWGQVADVNHGLFQPGKPVPHAYAPYSVITETMLNQGYVRYWDEKASVPYLYNAELQIFVSYEDPESIAAKCRYVLKQNLGGVMFWEYSNDPSGNFAARHQRFASSAVVEGDRNHEHREQAVTRIHDARCFVARSARSLHRHLSRPDHRRDDLRERTCRGARPAVVDLSCAWQPGRDDLCRHGLPVLSVHRRDVDAALDGAAAEAQSVACRCCGCT